MNADQFVRDVLNGGDCGIGASLTRAALTPLALLYQGGLEAYLWAEKIGWRKRYHLPVPVIAIGNLSSGGTGKTPMAAYLASGLQQQGKRVVVLSRGHGGTNESRREARIVSDGKNLLLPPEEAGDEPVLLARLLPGIPVIVCRDRRVSGRLAVERFEPDVIVLDDALQYWQLHRDLDIVLLDARRPFENGYVLPRGLLREPPSHLQRAGIIVLTRADRADPGALAASREEIRNLSSEATLLNANHALDGWIRSIENLPRTLGYLTGSSALAFSGIADGEAFLESIRREGVQPIRHHDFGDHHGYTREDVEALVAETQSLGNTAVAVTTEKDLVKVGGMWPDTAPPLYALRIGMRLSAPEEFWNRVNRVFK